MDLPSGWPSRFIAYNYTKLKIGHSQMSPASRARISSSTASNIVLPPPFRLVTLREVGDAFSHAMAHAAEEGAGTLVYVGRFDLAEFAVVLEPDEPLRTARRTLYAGMTALADALSVLAPPETPVTIDWPDAIKVNLGLVGGGRLGWPADANENEVPQWMVFGAMIRLVSLSENDAGLRPLTAALEDEGFDSEASDRMVEAFARHFMVILDTWQERGFAGVAKNYLPYLASEPLGSDAEKGLRRAIDENGDLLVRRMAKVDMGKADEQRRPLLPVLTQPSWFDPQTRGPRS
jgi:biotin-(acetyl-CoA carboxylase) ligase